MTIKGLIFDFDGLILDTEIPQYEAWQQIYNRYNCHLELQVYARCLGSSNAAFDPLHHLQSLVPYPIDLSAVQEEQRQLALQVTLARPVMPGVMEYLTTARRIGCRLAVASSSPLWWVGGHIQRLGLHSYFDCIRTSEDVDQVKPAPDLYQAALDCLGIAPHEAIALEDSPNGITAARHAGIFCVAVPNALSARLDTSHADLIVNSLDDLPLHKLITHVQSIQKIQKASVL